MWFKNDRLSGLQNIYKFHNIIPNIGYICVMTKAIIPFILLILALTTNACKSKKIIKPLTTTSKEVVVVNTDTIEKTKNPIKRENNKARNLTIYDSIPEFKNALVGYVFSDIENGSIVAEKNGDKYFRPASNTKILTLFSTLKELGDSLIFGEQFRTLSGEAVLKPFGDPTLDHPLFEYCGLKFDDIKRGFASIDLAHWQQNDYGKGWMWDDFSDVFTLPLSPMPVYGNRVYANVIQNGLKTIYEVYPMEHSYKTKIDTSFKEVLLSNDTICFPSDFNKFTPTQYPFKNINTWVKSQFKQNVISSNLKFEKQIKSCPIDSVLKIMMYDSDNFIAEQLLLQTGLKMTKIMNSSSAIDTIQKKYFLNKSNLPKWVDGSGLSHYNLMNPTFVNGLLVDMWKQHGSQKIIPFFPAGGLQGTLKSWYRNKEGKLPYVFAKTGTISNVYCLSGYLITNSNKPVAFSIMVNNFLGGSTPIKKEIETLLEFIRDHR